MKILAIETSCDETAIALMEAEGGLKNPRFKILKNLISSQIEIHRPFGGIVPNLAKREHLKNLPILFKKLAAGGYWSTPDLIAVTVGPGLEPALWTGINFAENLYNQLKIKNKKLKTKLVGVNHMEGHLYSYLLTKNPKIKFKNLFPAIVLLVSGGHTILMKMNSLVDYKKLGETRDDAVGEAFDKVARILNLPYPGGPEIEKLARSVPKGWQDAINFPRPMLNQKNYDFSFSGLKTAVLYHIRDSENLPHEKTGSHSSSDSFARLPLALALRLRRNHARSGSETLFLEANFHKNDIAASFQEAAFDVLIIKTLKAVKEFKAKSVLIGGGVASNLSLRKDFKFRIKNAGLSVKFFIPPKNFCTDNAAMIGVAGYMNYLKKKNFKMVAKGNLSL